MNISYPDRDLVSQSLMNGCPNHWKSNWGK
jgi:hypothetical protein